MTLDEIELEMKKCTQDGDFESAHIKADELLVKLVYFFVGQGHAQVDRITLLYDDMEKWYA